MAVAWDARDPRPVDEFIVAHVPRGSIVLGPAYFFFYAVERAGSRYVAVSRTSAADWTRWFPQSGIVKPLPRGARRYLVWPDYETLQALPPGLPCPGSHVVARFVPASDSRHLLGPLASLPGILRETYPSSTLYALPRGCGW